ncbi:hypothetical protein RB195_013581 [Necator americanus]|uniref:ADP-ribosylation factor family protein n=1 Tax=Necator americanus TaxID=51031 RepID=A0ABR1DW86_NECAM
MLTPFLAVVRDGPTWILTAISTAPRLRHAPCRFDPTIQSPNYTMGLAFSRLRLLFFGTKPCRILMVGLDNAGKTTILYKLKLGEVVTTIPTIGFNVETVNYRNLSFTVWDVGGQERIRVLWKYYFNNTEAVIFVVDSADRDRMEEARCELQALSDDPELRDAKFLVFANKQDLPNAMTSAEVIKALELHNFRNRQWYVQPSNAVTGEGLVEGLEWLHSVVLKG